MWMDRVGTRIIDDSNSDLFRRWRRPHYFLKRLSGGDDGRLYAIVRKESANGRRSPFALSLANYFEKRYLFYRLRIQVGRTVLIFDSTTFLFPLERNSSSRKLFSLSEVSSFDWCYFVVSLREFGISSSFAAFISAI